LERASARETAARVAVGAGLPGKLLEVFGINIYSYVRGNRRCARKNPDRHAEIIKKTEAAAVLSGSGSREGDDELIDKAKGAGIRSAGFHDRHTGCPVALGPRAVG